MNDHFNEKKKYNVNTMTLPKRTKSPIIYDAGIDNYFVNEIKKAKYQGAFDPTRLGNKNIFLDSNKSNKQNSENNIQKKLRKNNIYYNRLGDGKNLLVDEQYIEQEITVDYSFEVEEAHKYSIGQDFLSNIIVHAEIQFLLKDDNDGEEYTGILDIPTANIVGDINLIMGKKATPIVGDFAIQSVQSKTESRDKRSNYSLIILDRDITVI